MKIEIHETFRHDCTGLPDEYAELKVTTPYQFRAGDVVDVPDDLADYFIRAGWAALEGEEPVKPDKGQAVFVQPHNSTLGVRSKDNG